MEDTDYSKQLNPQLEQLAPLLYGTELFTYSSTTVEIFSLIKPEVIFEMQRLVLTSLALGIKRMNTQ